MLEPFIQLAKILVTIVVTIGVALVIAQYGSQLYAEVQHSHFDEEQVRWGILLFGLWVGQHSAPWGGLRLVLVTAAPAPPRCHPVPSAIAWGSNRG